MTTKTTERLVKLMKRKDGTLMNTDDDTENFRYGPSDMPKICAKITIGDFTYTVFLPIARKVLESDPALAERLLTEAAERFDPLSAESRGTPVQFTG